MINVNNFKLEKSVDDIKEKVDTLETMLFVLSIANHYESEVISVDKYCKALMFITKSVESAVVELKKELKGEDYDERG